MLYDLTSVWMEGRKCPLARRGHSRDGKRGKLQIEFGLLCDGEGRPVAVEVFPGNVADPATVGAQIEKLRSRFGLSKVVLVGDRGMPAEARIREEVEPAGLDWIGALRGPAIRKLAESGAAATRRRKWRLKGGDKIGERVGKVIGKRKMAKHFEWEVDKKGRFHYRRDAASIAAEAALDGIYVIRTSYPEISSTSRDGLPSQARPSHCVGFICGPKLHACIQQSDGTPQFYHISI